MFDMIAMLNPETIMIALVIVVILFGGSKIPELMRGVGSGMREFKKGLSEDEDEKAKAAKSDADKKDA
jgi:sec-independent protein translocase protein TatA